MDTAFDSQALRRSLRRRGIKASAPERKRRGQPSFRSRLTTLLSILYIIGNYGSTG